MTEPFVIYSSESDLATITLNRPDVLNAFTPELLAELHDALKRAIDDRQRAILITGAGRGFCAGQDLASIKDDYANGGPDLFGLLVHSFHPVIRFIRNAPLPVIAAVNGVAAGAGFSLALACDIRLAAENARFATAFTRIGLVPDCGMAYALPRLAGPGRASYLLLSGEQIDAPTALASGIVDKVLPATDFLASARAFALDMASGPTRAFALTKKMLHQAESVSFDALLHEEAVAQQEISKTNDHRNAVASFLAKQPATFEGA
jgi:2-(1,2-epoxy-1,2-dihydrophenyl)acetyl-CoA isomerase